MIEVALLRGYIHLFIIWEIFVEFFLHIRH